MNRKDWVDDVYRGNAVRVVVLSGPVLEIDSAVVGLRRAIEADHLNVNVLGSVILTRGSSCVVERLGLAVDIRVKAG